MAVPKMPRALRATTGDIGGGRYPKALLIACVSWVLLGIVLLFSRVGMPSSSDAQETDAATGDVAVRAPDADQTPFLGYLWVLGIVVVIVAVLLFLGQGWARLVLALLGLLAVVGLATSASWLVFPGVVLFVVGAVGSVMVSAHRYLNRPPDVGGHPDPETTGAVS